jgi:hypothetical protein
MMDGFYIVIFQLIHKKEAGGETAYSSDLFPYKISETLACQQILG